MFQAKMNLWKSPIWHFLWSLDFKSLISYERIYIIAFKWAINFKYQCTGSLTITYRTEKCDFFWLFIKSFRSSIVTWGNVGTGATSELPHILFYLNLKSRLKLEYLEMLYCVGRRFIWSFQNCLHFSDLVTKNHP